jgi:hypothetical protein
MNQRVLSSSSMMLKGVTLKSSDWGTDNANIQSIASSPLLRTRSNSSAKSIASSPASFATLTSNSSFKLDAHRSSFSLSREVQRLSSSGLSLAGASGNLSNSAMENASWDNITKPASNMFQNHSTSNAGSNSNIFLDGSHDLKAPRRSSKRLSLSNLLPLQEDHKDDEDAATKTDSQAKSNSKRSLSDIDDVEEFVVETFREKIPKQLCTRLSRTDLELLKDEDAFMYYSIPAVKKAVWEGKDVDFDVDTSSKPVKRCSAISFESADISLPVGDITDDIDDIDVPSLSDVFYDTIHANDDEDEIDLFMAFFSSLK